MTPVILGNPGGAGARSGVAPASCRPLVLRSRRRPLWPMGRLEGGATLFLQAAPAKGRMPVLWGRAGGRGRGERAPRRRRFLDRAGGAGPGVAAGSHAPRAAGTGVARGSPRRPRSRFSTRTPPASGARAARRPGTPGSRPRAADRGPPLDLEPLARQRVVVTAGGVLEGGRGDENAETRHETPGGKETTKRPSTSRSTSASTGYEYDSRSTDHESRHSSLVLVIVLGRHLR